MPWNDYIFVGTYTAEDYPDYITARTNIEAVNALKQLFPNKKVKSFELRKSNTEPKENALHLDCCFQPVGKDKAVIYRDGFKYREDVNYLIDFFGVENLFEISKEKSVHLAKLNLEIWIRRRS